MCLYVCICMGLINNWLCYTDISLEYDEEDFYQHFKEFYSDTLPEFDAVGHVVQFKVCCNYEQHLRGNVYVQYTR